MAEAIDRFLLVKRSENSSPNTIRAYHADLVDLSNFIGVEKGPEQLSREVIYLFLAALHHRGTSKTTANRRLSVIKTFVTWLRSDGIFISEDGFDKIITIKRPKSPNTLPDIPSQEQMAMLLDGDFPTAFPQRDRLLLELLYGSGLRVSEVAQIRVGDLRLEQNAILINGKGGPYGKSAKLRLVPLNAKSREALDLYLIERKKMLAKHNLETEALFFPVRDRYSPAKRGALNVRSVHRMLLYICKLRGLAPMHPHLLRHACGTHMLDNRCPLDVIGQILGHDNLDITAHYAQVSTKLMVNEYNRAHPPMRQMRSKNLAAA
jgi:site-specific recombinase XerD